MSEPDEFYLPDDGDPWHQMEQELEEQEAQNHIMQKRSDFTQQPQHPSSDSTTAPRNSTDPF